MPRSKLPQNDPRRKRRPLSLEQKGKVLNMLAEGKRIVDVATFFKVNESSIRTIQRNHTNVRESLQAAIPNTAKSIKNTRNLLKIKVDKLLSLFLHSQDKDGIPITRTLCSEKAMELHDVVARKMGINPTPPFKASNGWTHDFFKRHGFMRKLAREEEPSTNAATAQNFQAMVNRITEEDDFMYKYVREEEPSTNAAAAQNFQAMVNGMTEEDDFKYKHVREEEPIINAAAAQNFPALLKGIMEEGGYNKDQVFNVEGTALYWKKMPSSTYLSQETEHTPGVKPFKMCISLLLGCNASGSCKLKPLVLHTSGNPRAYKNIVPKKRGVHWHFNKRAEMTVTIMNEWFDKMFVPEVRAFCRKQNLDFKCILLLNNALGHSNFLIDRHPNVKVIFLPPRTSSLIQPMDKELIAVVKAHYYSKTFIMLSGATDITEEDEQQAVAGPFNASFQEKEKVLELWRGFNIKNAVDTLLASWEDVSTACIRHAWDRVFGGAVEYSSYDGNREQVDRTVAEAVKLARRIPGFTAVTADQVMDLVNTKVEQMVQELEQEEAQVGQQQKPHKESAEIGMEGVRQVLCLAEQLKDTIIEVDPNQNRAFAAVTQLSSCLDVYTQLLKQHVNKK